MIILSRIASAGCLLELAGLLAGLPHVTGQVHQQSEPSASGESGGQGKGWSAPVGIFAVIGGPWGRRVRLNREA